MIQKIFFDERIFIISNNFNECFTQPNGVGCKVNSQAEMTDLVTYFDTAHQTRGLWVYTTDIDEAFNWFCSNFKVVEAAGGLVQNKKGDYLLIYRFDHWDLPKGKREKNETPEETALREVEEECALTNLNLYPHITNTCHIYRQKGQLHLKKTHWYRMKYNGSALPQPQAEECIEKAVWVSVDALSNCLPTMYRSVVDVFQIAGIIN